MHWTHKRYRQIGMFFLTPLSQPYSPFWTIPLRCRYRQVLFVSIYLKHNVLQALCDRFHCILVTDLLWRKSWRNTNDIYAVCPSSDASLDHGRQDHASGSCGAPCWTLWKTSPGTVDTCKVSDLCKIYKQLCCKVSELYNIYIQPSCNHVI